MGAIPGGEGPPVLDQVFDSSSLYLLRAAVAAHAQQAGLPQQRADDLVVAVHELAANAVRHGGGRGRLRLWRHEHALRCQVTDDGAARAAGGRTTAGGRQRPAQWPVSHGHGLWVVHQVADHASLESGPHGSTATISFSLQPSHR